MTSDFPGSSSQQPFASPQPAPVPPNHAASPPTKQSLKTWAKWFRPPSKAQETHGNYSDYKSMFKHSKNPKREQSLFQESPMSDLAPITDGVPAKEFEQISPVRQDSRRFSFAASIFSVPSTAAGPNTIRWFSGSASGKQGSWNTPKKQRPASIMGIFGIDNALNPPSRRPASVLGLFGSDPTPGLPEKRPSSVLGLLGTDSALKSNSLTFKRNKFGRASRQSFIADSHRDSSETLEAGILPGPNVKALSHVFERFGISHNPRSKRANAKQTVKAVEPPTGIFGVPLRQSITYANVAISLVDAEGQSYIYGYVPIVVAKCGVYLKEKATNVEGIFRLSGSEKRIKELRTIFDSPDRYGKGLDWAGYTVHDAANVLRRYLNQLPEPIVPLDLYDRFRAPLKGHTMQAVGDTEGPQLPDNFDVGKAITTYQKLITELPPLNRQLLLYILDLLAVFASKADENRMTSNNLAAIFQPGMLSHPSHDMAPMEYRLSQDVLIFLIENQDHFLIGMRGTAADEQTVQEVQNGGTPPPGTPNTPKSKMVGRSTSNASAGADDVRKYGGVRRNLSVSSRHSRQSNGAPSPASPAYGASLTSTPTVGVHRSNTVPSKRSPALPSSRLQKNSGSSTPTSGAFIAQSTTAQALAPGASSSANRSVSPSSPGLTPTATVMGTSSLVASSNPTSVTSQERLLSENTERHPELTTPTREKPGFFNRSPTVESEKKAPNKLRKKRIPGSSNPSAQSSTQSLHGHQSAAASPAARPARGTQEVAEHTQLESIPSATPAPANSEATPPLTDTLKPEQHAQVQPRPEDPQHSSDRTLKPVASPASSLHSRSSFNDQSQSDADHDAAAAAEQKEKRSRWRLSRRREDSQSLGTNLTPKKGLGSDTNAAASSSSVGSSARPRKSFTGDTIPVGSESTLVNTHLQSSNESGSAHAPVSEEKKGPLGWIKNKMREKREENREKEAEKERNKSPPASTDRLTAAFSPRGKSVDIKREENPNRIVEEPATTKPQPQSPTQAQPPPQNQSQPQSEAQPEQPQR